MGSFGGTWLDRRVSVSAKETDVTPVCVCPFNNLSGFGASLLVGDSSAIE
jgi:hypothetical protein